MLSREREYLLKKNDWEAKQLLFTECFNLMCLFFRYRWSSYYMWLRSVCTHFFSRIFAVSFLIFCEHFVEASGIFILQTFCLFSWFEACKMNTKYMFSITLPFFPSKLNGAKMQNKNCEHSCSFGVCMYSKKYIRCKSKRLKVSHYTAHVNKMNNSLHLCWVIVIFNLNEVVVFVLCHKVMISNGFRSSTSRLKKNFVYRDTKLWCATRSIVKAILNVRGSDSILFLSLFINNNRFWPNMLSILKC